MILLTVTVEVTHLWIRSMTGYTHIHNNNFTNETHITTQAMSELKKFGLGLHKDGPYAIVIVICSRVKNPYATVHT